MRSTGPRDLYAGPKDGPEQPFPINLSGPVIKGFGRGSRELGIPTANIPPSGLDAYPDLQSGVYFGFVGLRLTPTTTQPADNTKLTLSSAAGASTTTAAAADASSKANNNDGEHDHAPPTSERTGVYPAVLSIGYNPFYANPTRSIEIHILRHFPRFNFYHAPLNVLILGFIRPEYDYESLEALVDDIRVDCDVARRSLERVGYERYREEEWLRDFGWSKDVDVDRVEGEVLKGDKEEAKEDKSEKKGSL